MKPKVKEAIDEFAERVKSEASEIDLILLYGSASKDRYIEGKSDIDLMVLSPEKKTYDKILDIQTDVGAKHGVAFSVLFESPSEIKKVLDAGSPFMNEVLRNGKVLYRGSRRRIEVGA